MRVYIKGKPIVLVANENLREITSSRTQNILLFQNRIRNVLLIHLSLVFKCTYLSTLCLHRLLKFCTLLIVSLLEGKIITRYSWPMCLYFSRRLYIFSKFPLFFPALLILLRATDKDEIKFDKRLFTVHLAGTSLQKYRL